MTGEPGAPAVWLQDGPPGVLRARLGREQTGNGITAALLAGLHQALDRSEADPGGRILLIESTGPVFCSGMDLAAAMAGSARSSPADSGREFLGLLRRFTRTPRLVVSLVEGRANGGGVGIVAASDLVLAGPAATFALPEALWGLLPACILPSLLRRIGFQAAYRMTLTTLPMTAAQAAAVQLVDEVHDDPAAAVRTLARRLRRIDAATIGEAKRYSTALWSAGADQEQLAIAEFSRLMGSELVRTRIAAFLDTASIGG